MCDAACSYFYMSMPGGDKSLRIQNLHVWNTSSPTFHISSNSDLLSVINMIVSIGGFREFSESF